jgi:small-conductance mechanosensitive channel/CRP-like cAMP-binding protein
MLIDLLLIATALTIRAISRNRHVRGRLVVAATAFLLHGVTVFAAEWVQIPDAARQQLQVFGPILLAFGAILGLVTVLCNPLRTDRLPDQLPAIVQDLIVLTLFAISASMVVEERVFAATAVSAVVIGIGMRDTLGNLFAGLAIQVEKPFRVGQWIKVQGIDAQVSEITWRATKLRTLEGNLLVVPNNAVANKEIVNYSEPSLETKLTIDVSVGFDVPPNRVKRIILEAIQDEPLMSKVTPPQVLLWSFDESAIAYRVWVWTEDFHANMKIKDRIRIAIYYALHRCDISMPFPTRKVIMSQDASAGDADMAALTTLLGRVSLFSGLEAEQIVQIANLVRRRLYADGEPIVRQGDPGSSMFVLLTGEAVVSIEPGHIEVARIASGGFFGEMCLLTGANRTASVRAAGDSEVIEIAADAFRQVIMAHPAIVERLGTAVAQRQEALDEATAQRSGAVGMASQQNFVVRIRRFFGLGG